MRHGPRPLVLATLVACGSLLAGDARAQCTTDDGLEHNDSCATALPIDHGRYETLRVSDTDLDHYEVSVPAGATLRAVVVDPSLVFVDLDLVLFDSSCGSPVAFGAVEPSGATVLDWHNSSSTTVDMVLRVDVLAVSACRVYDLTIESTPGSCVGSTDDGLEDNDSCGAAAALPLGWTTNLVCTAADADFYAIDVAAASELLVDIALSDGQHMSVQLYDDLACSNVVGGFVGTPGNHESLSYFNSSAATQSLILAVERTSVGCTRYDLDVTMVVDPCAISSADDGFEPNDVCGNAVPLPIGVHTDLFVSKADEDFYEFTVQAGDSLVLDFDAHAPTIWLDSYLYDDPVACGTRAGYLTFGLIFADLSWTNTTGTAQTYYLQLVVEDSAFNPDCTQYDVTYAGVSSGVVTSFCAGDGTADVGSGPVACPCGNESALGAGVGCLHGLGFGGRLSATGTTSVANDDLVLTVSQARPGQPCILVQGHYAIAIPFKDGVFCMGNETRRMGAIPISGSAIGSTTGSIVTDGAILPGQTRVYQAWFRDPGGISPCGTGSNFTQALSVSWI